MAYSSKVNPCIYVSATLEGNGIRDEELTRAFAKMVQKKLKKKIKQKWPLTPEELIESLESNGPFKELFNVIAWSLHPERTLNKYGFVTTPSKTEANKLWALSSDWEALLTRERSAKAAALSLTIHRLTGSKETVRYLHNCGHGISYNDIQLLSSDWAKKESKSAKHGVPKSIQKQKAVHISIDNSDGRQQTLTGANTTHYTNGIIFQVDHSEEVTEEVVIEEEVVLEVPETELENEEKYGSYKIKKKISPPPMTYEDSEKNSILEWCLKRDIAWVLTSAIGHRFSNVENLEPIGSWTVFMKKVTKSETKQALLEYLPVVPLPPTDNICKWYLDRINKMIEELESDCVFLHADEAVYSKILMIKWIETGDYEKIVPLLGGFHTILVFLKILHKKYGVLGLKEWWIDSEAIQPGSADKADEGKHYFRSV